MMKECSSSQDKFRWFSNPFFAPVVAAKISSNMVSRKQGDSAINVEMQSVLAARLFEIIAIEAICRQ